METVKAADIISKDKIYNCTENDNLIKVVYDGDRIDELWFKSEGEVGWVVIGYKDLILATKPSKKTRENLKFE